MEIINLFVKLGGLNEIMLIGDPDQAIFEWNKARPELFENKYKKEGWHPIPFNENRRSSQLICNVANAFLGEKKSEPYFENNAKDCQINPSIVEYIKDDQKSIDKIKEEFLRQCELNSIDFLVNDPRIAIVYRSKAFGENFGFPVKYDNLPWITGKFYVRDIVQGKFLFENGEYKKGYKLMEQGYLKALKQFTYISQDEIQKVIDEKGFKEHRNEIFSFISKLPQCYNCKINNWLWQAQDNISEIDFQVNLRLSDILISDLFNQTREKKMEFPYHLGTIHSVKGSTFDAVLVYLGERAGKQAAYQKLFTMPKDKLKPEQAEELRIVYVGITRPRKLLMVAVPKGSKEIWDGKLKVN
jgi:superfamily I DNA/RNA helicase